MRFLSPSKYAKIAYALVENQVKGESVNPFYASLKLTNRCRFRCRFCNVWMEKTPELDTKGMMRVMDSISGSSVVLTSFEGGEPLLRKDIGELLRYARTKQFYLLFTTSERKLWDYPMQEYCRYIDFLHVSIDEGHENLDMFDHLELYKTWNRNLCIQTVVRAEDLEALPDKVRRCHEAGAKILVMPAVHLDKTESYYPDEKRFREVCLELKREYPKTMISPDRYFDNIARDHGCNTSSIIVDVDGALFYPCRTLETRAVNLCDTPLDEYVHSEEAARYRRTMASCSRRCGWYQYFATSSFTSPADAFSSLKPYFGFPAPSRLTGSRKEGTGKVKR